MTTISFADLCEGLQQHAKKFRGEDANALPPGSPEREYFMLEAALQHGFEMIDHDGDVYVCNSRQIVSLIKAVIANPGRSEP